MNLKNYLLEYVSSGRSKRIKSGHPVESDTLLTVGDILRVKDMEWFDSLEKDDYGEGVIRYGKGYILFTRSMIKYLDEKVVIQKVMEGNIPRYNVSLLGKKDSIIGQYTFTNDMLEYI
jgi:hypothetical protein